MKLVLHLAKHKCLFQIVGWEKKKNLNKDFPSTKAFSVNKWNFDF